MVEIMKSLHIDWRDRILLPDLYMRQGRQLMDSDTGVIGRGVRQEFSISALLFSIYAEAMMLEGLEDMKEGVLLQGSWL